MIINNDVFKHIKGIEDNSFEFWRDIKGYEGYYQISSFGKIKSYDREVICNKDGSSFLKKGRLLKHSLSKKYPSVILSVNNIRKVYYIHRLVALTFLPNLTNSPQVNHIDGDKENNKVENLEWVTAKENIRHAFSNGLNEGGMKGKFGKNHNRSKPILQLDLKGNTIKEFGSSYEVERELNIAQQNISKACKGKRKTAGGYGWKYVD